MVGSSNPHRKKGIKDDYDKQLDEQLIGLFYQYTWDAYYRWTLGLAQR